MEAALENAAERGGGTVHFWVFRPTQIHDALAHRLGFSRGRELLQMRRPLPHPEAPRWPGGTVVRASFPAATRTPGWRSTTGPSPATWNRGGWTEATLPSGRPRRGSTPPGFLVAERRASLAGFCWTKVHPDGVGEIYVIAVDPAPRAGLGKALVLGGLASLAERGITTGMLYVDAANEGAVGLYRHLGFDVHHVDRAYVAELAP